MTRVGDDTGDQHPEQQAPSQTSGAEAALREAQRQVETLRRALETRGVIDQAKGVLMALYRIGPDAAFERLSTVSQSENVKVATIARALVALVAQAGVDDRALELIVRRRLLAPATLGSATLGSDSDGRPMTPGS